MWRRAALAALVGSIAFFAKGEVPGISKIVEQLKGCETRFIECILVINSSPNIGKTAGFTVPPPEHLSHFVAVDMKRMGMAGGEDSLRLNLSLLGKGDNEVIGVSGHNLSFNCHNQIIGWRLPIIFKGNVDIGSIAVSEESEKCHFDENMRPQLARGGILHCRQSGLSNLGLNLSGVGRFLGSIGRNFSVVQAFADEPKLPEKENKLAARDDNEQEGKKTYGIVRNPVPKAFVWLIVAGFGAGMLAGGVMGWLVNRFGGRPNKTAPDHEPHDRRKQRPK